MIRSYFCPALLQKKIKIVIYICSKFNKNEKYFNIEFKV